MSASPFVFSGQKSFYQGKVRDVYSFGKYLLMITSNRISAFDVVLPREIPYKGQVLNQIAAHFLKATSDIVPNWLLTSPAPNAAFGLACEPIPIEMVVRGYLVGHLWREYKSGKREVCGVLLPDGLKENQKLPNPIITPTTKASEGHDEDISIKEILNQGIVSPSVMAELEEKTYALFDRGQQMADDKNLILVDTKYEFGFYEGKIMLMDEIHTPDSSRYFYKESYQTLFEAGEPQKQLSKEFVREWLIANNFQGKEGQTVPVITDEFVNQISERYILLFEEITGSKFTKEALSANYVQDIYSQISSFI
ncbi:phosphoribosylaminoimidazolesuccinocarboxamide synthase [Aquirufa regiilacus]|uniref:Phosphoribosylaminoimidazole-succinocarboxamide synthase n=1 Tax=Aquirufa regiilacus TaxID=3024868 RepID=A0ABU3TQP6_9BACT|nr:MULTISPECIES: phosphoribosylaminoimidazolesuccinocarboxamide synthase [unclassified Aquirufa]MDT8886839.1 phosphoribosylaminoimidazolesuccinocarboxamide synthase [Aquirufa sp. LEPPI-3A]MDU0808196.1 phosphoribosylaminoimidazolesuccinocarboxamide synthase [Aquirufa sp. LEOWEIH-7C]